MKTSYYLMLVCLIGIAAATSLAGFMRSRGCPDQTQCSLAKLHADAGSVWDETAADSPPLSPGAAIRIAKEYIRWVRSPDQSSGWELDNLTLQRVSFSGGPARWAYLANFKASLSLEADPTATPLALQVPVRFDGTVPLDAVDPKRFSPVYFSILREADNP